MMVVLCVIANLMTLLLMQSQILINEKSNLQQGKQILEKMQFQNEVYEQFYAHRRKMPWQDLNTARYSFVKIDPYTIEVTIDGCKAWFPLPKEALLCRTQIE